MNDVRLFEAKYEEPIKGPIRVELVQDTGRDNVNHAKHFTGQTLFRRDSETFDEFRSRCFKEWGKSQNYYCAIFERKGGYHERTTY